MSGDQSSSAGLPEAEPPAQPDSTTTPVAGRTRMPIAALRGRTGEVVAAAASVALLVVMVMTEWYGVAGVPDPSYARPAVSTAETGWDGLSDVRWVIVATAVVAVGSLLLHASQREHGVETDTGRAVAGLGLLSAALLAYRVLISLPGGGRVLDQKLGALIGLALALAVAWGGWEAIAEQRARASGPATHPRRPRRRPRRASPSDEDASAPRRRVLRSR
ncbi:MAG: hypothetical protein ACRDMJ_09860 [Solirubrobacteraceae bacterium]